MGWHVRCSARTPVQVGSRVVILEANVVYDIRSPRVFNELVRERGADRLKSSHPDYEPSEQIPEEVE